MDDMWKGKTLNEFIEMTIPEMNKQRNKHNISTKVIKLACQFLRIKFDRNELSRSVEREVAMAIDEALIYFVNVANESIED